jgi:nicotinamidase-related amidase
MPLRRSTVREESKQRRSKMANLGLEAAKTAVVSMDTQRGPVGRSAMFRERNVGQAAKTVLEAARRAGILVVHVVIEHQPAFYSPRNKFLQKIRIPILSAPGVNVAELLEIVDEVKPVGDEPVIRKPRMNPFHGTNLDGLLRSRDIDTVVLMGVATEFVVEAAARHAADLDYRVIVLEDCCAGFSEETHRVALHVMDHFAVLATSNDFVESVR